MKVLAFMVSLALLAPLSLPATNSPRWAMAGTVGDVPVTLLSIKTGDAQIGDLASAPSFEVELPDGQFARAYARERLTRPSWDGTPVTRWIGHLAGVPDSEIALTQKGQLTVGTVRLENGRWYLFPDGELKWIDPTEQHRCGTAHRNAVSRETLLREDRRALTSTAAAVEQTIDILAVYDSTFLAEASGTLQAEIMIEDAIARASLAERNSNAGARYRLVGIVKLRQNIPPAAPFTVLLGPEVEALRNQYGADFVQGYLHFFPDENLPWSGLSNGYHNGADTGFASVVIYHAAHLETPAHELGHNRGADHEEETAHRPPPARPFGFCPPDGSEGWGTIMWSGQTPLPERCIWSKINYFSNPQTTYNGRPLGIPGQQDNAKVMRATAAQIVGFRQPVVQPPTCSPGKDVLCLNNSRFLVEVIFQTPAGNLARAQAVPLTNDTGYFWFFAPTNVEVIVKVLDACAQPFNHYWVFAAGLTNVKVTITITDTKTGEVRTYNNPSGTKFAPIQDSSAFATCP